MKKVPILQVHARPTPPVIRVVLLHTEAVDKDLCPDTVSHIQTSAALIIYHRFIFFILIKEILTNEHFHFFQGFSQSKLKVSYECPPSKGSSINHVDLFGHFCPPPILWTIFKK